MDFLNKAYTQISDLFRSMSPGARLTSGLLVVVIMVSLAFLFRTGTSMSGTYLYGGNDFSQSELATMENAFAKAGLNKSEIIGNRIRVPSSQKADYLAALVDNNAMPANPYSFLNEATNSTSPFTTNKTLEAKIRNAKQQELALIISRMRDIEFATVHYDEIEKRGFPRRKEKTATVAVKATGDNRIEEDRVRAIRNLVAAAYAGMSTANVTVTDINGGTYPGSSAGGIGSAMDNPYAALKSKYEKQWSNKISDYLRWIPGVIVGVNVELNKELLHQENSIKLNPKDVITTSSKDETKTSTTSSANPGGRPGAVSNGLSNSTASISSSAGINSEISENSTQSSSITSRDYVTKKTAALTPSAVTVSVGVPVAFYKKIWREENPAEENEEPKDPTQDDINAVAEKYKTKIEEQLKQLIPPPVSNTDDPYPRFTIETLPDLPSLAVKEPGMSEKASAWLAIYWQPVGMTMLGLFSLLMLRGMIRSVPSAPTASKLESTPAAQLSVENNEDEDEEETETVNAPKLRRFKTDGPNLKDELADVVREDTEAAAKVLRSWIGDAA